MSLGGAPDCPTCHQRVYFNDEKNFGGKSWHKKCFKCSTDLFVYSLLLLIDMSTLFITLECGYDFPFVFNLQLLIGTVLAICWQAFDLYFFYFITSTCNVHIMYEGLVIHVPWIRYRLRSFNLSQFMADEYYFIHRCVVQFCLDSAFGIGINISENCSKLLESGVANISTDEELLCNACIRKMTHQHSAKHEASAFNIVCFISDIREVCYTSIGLVILATGAFGCNKII